MLRVHMLQESQEWIRLVINSDLPLKAPKYITSILEVPKRFQPFLRYQHKSVNSRIDKLLKGDDL